MLNVYRVAYILFIFCIASFSAAASSWGFEDATVSVQSKQAGVGGSIKEKLSPHKALPKQLHISASDTLKIILTAKEDKQPKRPHQAFLLLQDPDSRLDTSLVFSVRDNGEAKLELTQKDLPPQLLHSTKPLSASLLIASFGTAKPYFKHAFDLSIERDASSPAAPLEKPLRYGKLPEIHHIFKPEPKSPPKIITLVFVAVVVASLPVLVTTWLSLGANVTHLSTALKNAPLAHSAFFLSILSMETIFFKYYTSWNLFQTLPAAVTAGLVIFLSGSRALSEVQERRLSGLR